VKVERRVVSTKTDTLAAVVEVPIFEFDALALFEAMDAERAVRGLSWRGVADELWDQSAVLNDRRSDHPISHSSILSMGNRSATSCQHALFMLRWLGRSPESFLAGSAPGEQVVVDLPVAGPDRRLRWNLKELYAALDAHRRERELTWPELARVLRCTPSQLTGIRTARFATGMDVAMRIVQWLERPAADFIHPEKW
jgi:hypothetical protein